MYLIEWKYKGQISCQSYSKKESIEDVIDWLNRFDNYTLEDFTEIDKIDEIRITLKDSPIVIWFQLIRKNNSNCDKCNTSFLNKDFEVTLICNDYPVGTVFSKQDLHLLLKQFKENL